MIYWSHNICRSNIMSRAVVVAGVLLAVCLETNDAAFAPGSLVRGTNNAGQSSAFLTMPKRQTGNARQIAMRAESDDDDEEDAIVPGMADAFRQLGDLDSLGDGEEAKPASQPIKKPTLSSPDESLPSVEPPPPEKEVQMYKAMVKDLEQQNEDDLYSNVLADMGGSASAEPKESQASPTTSVDVIESDTTLGETEDFMNQALNEAMKEVKLNNPSIAESILDDKEIMKEIEVIFERGNEKLMTNLEEIRQEQLDMASESAEKNAQKAVDGMQGDAARLAQAERAIKTMLDRVKKETGEVEKAVEDLKKAEAEIDKDFILKLKRGGLPKQAALIGLLLFSVRSIGDTVVSFSDETHLAAALIQGGIALVCAAYLFLV